MSLLPATHSFFFFNDTATTEIYTLSLHDALPIFTWSENLDQTQAVPGSGFSIAPNGGAGIVGTAAAVSYPAADQTRFALSSDVDHLDALALTYTKPGSEPMVRDAAGNAAVTATLANASITHNA